MGRKNDPIWRFYIETKKSKNSGKWAVCKSFSIEMQDIPKRMKHHHTICNSNMSNISLDHSSKRSKTETLKVIKDDQITATSDDYHQLIDNQVGRFKFATNSPFRHTVAVIKNGPPLDYKYI